MCPGNLSHPGLVASAGNSVTNGRGWPGVRRLFGSSVSSGLSTSRRCSGINDLGFRRLERVLFCGNSGRRANSDDNTTFRLAVMVKSNSPSGYAIASRKAAPGATATFDATERHAGDTVLLAGKYDFTASPNAVSL